LGFYFEDYKQKAPIRVYVCMKIDVKPALVMSL